MIQNFKLICAYLQKRWRDPNGDIYGEDFTPAEKRYLERWLKERIGLYIGLPLGVIFILLFLIL